MKGSSNRAQCPIITASARSLPDVRTTVAIRIGKTGALGERCRANRRGGRFSMAEWKGSVSGGGFHRSQIDTAGSSHFLTARKQSVPALRTRGPAVCAEIWNGAGCFVQHVQDHYDPVGSIHLCCAAVITKLPPG